MSILNPELPVRSEAAPVSSANLLRAQREGYARYHRSRANLLLHIVFVPLFLVGNVAFAVAFAQRRWPVALGAALLTILSLALQGRGHRREPVAPQPFTGPRNALARIFLEQWVTFPRFVLSGAWRRALRSQPAGKA